MAVIKAGGKERRTRKSLAPAQGGMVENQAGGNASGRGVGQGTEKASSATISSRAANVPRISYLGWISRFFKADKTLRVGLFVSLAIAPVFFAILISK